ncbi:MAG: hypothetical protein A2042_04910, partial [Candidatus Schekmanbacteria bacterium GWA2_38_11]
MKKIIFFSVVCAITLLCAVNSQAVIIDSFTKPQTLFRVSPGTSPSSVSSISGDILGNERDITITSLDSGSMIGTTAYLDGLNIYSHSQGAAVRGTSTIQWDGSDNSPALNPTGLGGIDLTEGGATKIILKVRFKDLSLSFPLTVSVYTDASNWSKYILNVSGSIAPQGVEFILLFADFIPQAGTGADFTNVGAISLTIDGSNIRALDVELRSIETPPPPPCAIEVEKTCSIEPPPPSPFVCSDAKPLDSITMIWNGTQPIKIKAWKGAIGSTLLPTIDNIINVGDEIT